RPLPCILPVRRARSATTACPRSRGGGAVEKAAAPDLEVDERPHAHEPVVVAGEIAPPDLLDLRGLEEPAPPRPASEQEILGHWPQLRPKPSVERQPKAVLPALDDLARQEIGGEALQNVLPATAPLQLRRHGRDELDDAVVEIRHARLEAD